ncbi:hypothetical protein DPMN_080759 [Dreissena polymorpha]|uniref:Uncharacterized protein n=1 Tax=Dreissena polymorpha TaxID=45954 RepID=A0A9D3YRH5_DREPO|nr:hypothetical protein DPMN_080759 [Dreissena polymorpha]
MSAGDWKLGATEIIRFGFGNCLHDVVPCVTDSVQAYYGLIADVTGELNIIA